MINRKPRQTRKQEQWVEVPLPEGTYADPTKPFSQQDLVNYLKEPAEAQGTRSSFKLLGVPGMLPWASIGDGPFRGARNVEGKRLAVLGHYLYQFSTDGTSAVQLGYVPGTGLVQMSHNQIAGGHEVAIATGSAGYVYNTVTEVFAKITDPSFSGGKSVTFIDQMFVWVDRQGRFFQPSDIAAGTVYTALEEQEAEMAPDRIQCAIAAHQKLYVFGKQTLQSYTSTGDPEELFADDKAGIDVGCASPHAVALIDNTLIWVDEKGIGRRLSNGIAQRITTHVIEKHWAECDLSKCNVFTWEDVGHAVVYFNFPDGKTWGYDCATQRWHRRKSKGMDRWRANGLVKWDEVWYAGAFNSGEISQLDWDYPLEGCDELIGEVDLPVLHNGGNWLQVDGVRVQFDTGYPSVECVHVDPIIADDRTEGDFSLLPFWLGRTANAGQKDTYAAPVAMTSGITTIHTGPDAGPHLGGDYALTYSGAGTLYAWKVNRTTGAYETYPITDTVSSTSVTMSRDGQWFVAMSGTTLYSFQNTGTGFERIDSLGAYAYVRMAFAPDGERFVGWTSSNRVDFYDLDTTTGAITAGLASGDAVERFAWSRDGRYLAWALSQPAPSAGTLSIYDTHNGTAVLDFRDSIPAFCGNVTAMDWNRTGTKLFCAGATTADLSVFGFDGTNLTLDTNHDLAVELDYVAEARVSPTGKYLMVVPFGSFDSRLYAIASNGTGSGIELVSQGSFGTDRGGVWTDFYDTWED